MSYDAAFRAMIVAEYEAGESISGLSRIHKVSEPTISKWLKKAGVTIRRTNGMKLSLDRDYINGLYDEGKSTYQIAKIVGCSDETVRKLVVNMRTESERNRHDEEAKRKIAESNRALWQDEEYRLKVSAGTSTPEYKEALSRAAKARTHLTEWVKSAEGRLAVSRSAVAMWTDKEYRKKQAKWAESRTDLLMSSLRTMLADPEKKVAWLDKLRHANASRRSAGGGWVSSSQKQLYYLLDEAGVEHHEEGEKTRVGPFYVVDCIVPRQQTMRRDLIIEVQGEYWHSLPRVMSRDRQKRTYVERHTDYDLLCLDELNLKSFDEVSNKLSDYGISLPARRCKVSELEIVEIPESEAEMFYSVFHYSNGVRKGATTYGAFHGDVMVAAISYTTPIRQQIAGRLGLIHGELLEISRLARRTNVVCHNLASFLLGRSRKMLPTDVKCVVSYSDSTYGHTGKVYEAAGFKNDGVVEADYYYASMFGKYHKKTIWDRSKRMKMSEADYATKHGLVRVPTKPKIRWVYFR